MTTDLETIDGHLYQVTRDDQGNIMSEVGCDPPPSTVPAPIRAKIQTMIGILKTGTATQAQQQMALALILGMLLNLSDV